jgi:hypothetical protein
MRRVVPKNLLDPSRRNLSADLRVQLDRFDWQDVRQWYRTRDRTGRPTRSYITDDRNNNALTAYGGREKNTAEQCSSGEGKGLDLHKILPNSFWTTTEIDTTSSSLTFRERH